MKEQTRLKRSAAQRAVELVQSGMILGLGTGSTSRFALEEIGRRIRAGQLKNVLGIPSSLQTQKLAQELAIPLTRFDEHLRIDLTIDGADEVDPNLNLIKGGGGALLREKILAQASQRVVIIVDDSKLSTHLGTRGPLPVEVLPFARALEASYIESLGARAELRQNPDGTPFRTDQGNYILDCYLEPIVNAEQLDRKLNQRAGIVEHGLFLGLATDVIVAGKKGIQHLKPE